MRDRGLDTFDSEPVCCEGDFAGYFWKRRVDELFEVGFFVIDVVEWLPGAEGGFAVFEDAG